MLSEKDKVEEWLRGLSHVNHWVSGTGVPCNSNKGGKTLYCHFLARQSEMILNLSELFECFKETEAKHCLLVLNLFLRIIA